MFERVLLEPGEGDDLEVDLSQYVSRLLPGVYYCRVHYTDWDFGLRHPLGVVTVCSDWITLFVEPRVVRVTASEQERVWRMIAALPERGEVVLVCGRYGPWAHAQVPPDSPAGALLEMSWSAVPALIHSVSVEPSGVRRTWILALLHGITGWVPLRDEALGSHYELVEADDGVTATVVAPDGHGYGPNAAAQAEAIAKWSRLESAVRLAIER